MKVLIDLGNTRLKAGLLHPTLQGPELATTFATSYDQPQAFSQWLERTLLNDPDHQVQALGISVVSERTRSWVENILKDHQCQVQRSEEHTSELQSRGHIVCRLLLVKINTV